MEICKEFLNSSIIRRQYETNWLPISCCIVEIFQVFKIWSELKSAKNREKWAKTLPSKWILLSKSSTKNFGKPRKTYAVCSKRHKFNCTEEVFASGIKH